MNDLKCYSELIKFKTFRDRYNYLKLNGCIGFDTFGFDRYLNQAFYTSVEWKRIRDQVILRDNACDLGIDDREIFGKIFIHHMNPISKQDIIDVTDYLLNPEYLVCVSFETHNRIHFGMDEDVPIEMIERKSNDQTPWR